mmetsp:Transcript_10161/g.9852  ORF Transcript_10161/g.9852 Transcript_10161/m.9852 type:complete len:244 (+) Transcript_10161:243-974(+)
MLSRTSKVGIMPIVLRDLMALADITDDQTIKLYDVMIVKIKKQFVLTSLETGTASRGPAREISFNLRVTNDIIIRLNEISEYSIDSCSDDCMNIIDSTMLDDYIDYLMNTTITEERLLNSGASQTLNGEKPINAKKYSASNKRKSKKEYYSDSTIDDYSDKLFSGIKKVIADTLGDNKMLIKLLIEPLIQKIRKHYLKTEKEKTNEFNDIIVKNIKGEEEDYNLCIYIEDFGTLMKGGMTHKI